VRKEDFAEAVPQMSHLFKVNDSRHGKVFLPEAFVVHEEVDALQRAHQQKGSTYKEDKFHEQQSGGTCREKNERQALAMEFGISPREIAEQQQALNYASEQKEIEGQNKCQNRKEFEEVQKAVTEQISVKEQMQRLEEIRQNREKLSKQPKDTQQNATTTGAGMNVPNVQVPSSHSGLHPPRRGPGLPHQHTQPPSRPSQSGGHLGSHHQFSLDENRTSPPSRRPLAHQLSHEYETVRVETTFDIQRQGNSHEENKYDHLGSRGFRGPQSGEQPLHLLSTQRATQNPVTIQRASQHQALPHSVPLHPSPQPTPPQQWDPNQNQFFTDQAPYAFSGSSQQGEVLPGKLGVGSTVQISDPPRYGVIRWIGELPNFQGYVAGVELVR